MPVDSISDARKRAAMGVLEALLVAGVTELPVEGEEFLQNK